jgi:hypothetical protein
VPLLRIRSTAIDRHVHQRCPTARNIGDGRCRSRPSITVLAHPSNLVLTHIGAIIFIPMDIDDENY